ncbi:MAG: cell division protein ZapA [Sphingomonadales bacterium]|nr:cell division protein ZapA [Sphingomonadales bacterium]MDE2169081.1 cell division protein ZapA [Sphingomonadales bacterium]
MSNVSLSVGGRDYVVACAPGEEEHLADLGRMIDAKLASLPLSATQGETRALLFAALLLADDLHELRGAQTAPPPAPDPARLLALATSLENLADLLEAPLEDQPDKA